MGKATPRAATPTATRQADGRELLRRAERLHADALAAIGACHDLAPRYEGLVGAVNAFGNDIAATGDALLEVHEALGLHSVLHALEVMAQQFEDAGLVSFASSARDTLGRLGPPLRDDLRASTTSLPLVRHAPDAERGGWRSHG